MFTSTLSRGGGRHLITSGLIKESMHVDTSIWTELLLLPGTRLIRRIVIITRLVFGNLGTSYRLSCVVDAMAALHPILLTTSEVRGMVVHFIHRHHHDVGIWVALILRDLRVGLILDEASIEEWFAIGTEICLFLVAIKIWTWHWRGLFARLNANEVVSVSAQRSSNGH